MTKVNFASVIHEFSGYGQFSRQFISALAPRLDLTVEAIGKPSSHNVNFGQHGQVTSSLLNKHKNYDVNVFCWVPTAFPDFQKKNKKNVIFTMWEANKLPALWTEQINKADAVFVPSFWNKSVFEKSGVKVPIHVVHPYVEPQSVLPKSDSKEYRFYSIFQWTERKNPQALIKAYFSEFAGHDDVVLVLKTYRHSHLNNDVFVKEQIEILKKELKMSKAYPKILLNTSFLDEQQVTGIHNQSHCFVLPHRAEGVGLPHMEAMYHGNPCIATNYSGNTDFMIPENSYLLDYQLTPVTNMSWYVPWFDASEMYWADASVYQLAKLMRFCYQNKKSAEEKGKLGQATILNSFNAANSADMFCAALNKIT